MRSIALGAAALAAAMLTTACSDSPSTAPAKLVPGGVATGQATSGTPATPFAPALEYFQVCKVYTEGSGPAVTVDYTVTGGVTASGSVTLQSGGCRNIWVGNGVQDIVTVTEHVPNGYSAAYTKSTITRVSGPGTCPTLSAPTCVTSTSSSGPTAGNSASGPSGGTAQGVPGTLVVFTNTLIPVHLAVSKTITSSFRRTYQWNVKKTNTDAQPVAVQSGQTVDLHYTIDVTQPGSSDDQFQVSGDITIDNDGGVDALVKSVTDLSNFGAASVTCPAGLPQTLAPNASLVCTYTQNVNSAAAISNTATATAANAYGGGDSQFSGQAQQAFATTPATEVNKCVVVTDNLDPNFSQTVCVGGAPASFPFTFTAGPYDATKCGKTVHVDNTASITGDANTLLGSSTAGADILVQCPPPAGCTRTIGYWKTHAGGVGSNPDVVTALLPIWLGTSGGAKSVKVTTAAQAISLLSMTGGASNGIVKLYAQLLGAKLSIAAGADGSAVSATIAAADAYLATHNPADWAGLTKAQQSQVLAWMTTLDSYNNGLIGPIHCI